MTLHADIGPFCIQFIVSMARAGHEDEQVEEVDMGSATERMGFTA